MIQQNTLPSDAQTSGRNFTNTNTWHRAGDASTRVPPPSRKLPSISLRVSLRDPDDCGATSSSFSGPWIAGRCTPGKFDAALPGSPGRRDLRGHPNYDNRDGHDHRLATEPLEVLVPP